MECYKCKQRGKRTNIVKNLMSKMVYVLLLVFSVILVVEPNAITHRHRTNQSMELNKNIFNNLNPENADSFSELGQSSSDVKYSIFLNEPTYSFSCADKIYFLDDYDKNLKVFDTTTENFLQDYLSFAQYGKLIDVVAIESNIIMLFENNNFCNIVNVNLVADDFSIACMSDVNGNTVELNTNYTKIFANKIDDKIYVVLTPKTNYSPIVLTFDPVQKQVLNQVSINFDNENITPNIENIKKSLFKVLLINSDSAEISGYANIVFVCESGLYGASVKVCDLAETEIILSDTNFSRMLDSSTFDKNVYESISLFDVNISCKNSTNYIFITYITKTTDGSVSAYTKIYELNISLVGSGSTFKVLTTFTTPCCDYVCLSNDKFTYPEQGTICYYEIDYSSNEYLSDKKIVKNPTLQVDYFSESDFEIISTTGSAEFLLSPWNSKGIITLEANSDLIVIGKSKIQGTDYSIEDFKYCLYTKDNKNLYGYVKTSLVKAKNKISLSDYPYSKCYVVPKTALYSAPTKVLNENITNVLVSTIICNITCDEEIEIIDTLCNYTTDGSIFVKVRTANGRVGYIETNQIITKNDLNYYIINDSVVLVDCKIYAENSTESSIICEISEGTRVKILSSKDKNTGLVNVEYSDENCETVVGFILFENVKNDEVSTTQVFVSVLVVVNVFALLVILIRKLKTEKDSDLVKEIISNR